MPSADRMRAIKYWKNVFAGIAQRQPRAGGYVEVDRPPPQLKRRNIEGAATSPFMNIEIINICSVFPFKNSNTCNLAPTRSFDVIPLSYFIPKHNLGRLCIFGVAQNLINERFAIGVNYKYTILIWSAASALATEWEELVWKSLRQICLSWCLWFMYGLSHYNFMFLWS